MLVDDGDHVYPHEDPRLHRSYHPSQWNDPIGWFISDLMVAARNPGELTTPTGLFRGETQSQRPPWRNPTLMAFARVLGWCRGEYLGLRRIREEVKNGKFHLDVEARDGFVTTRLWVAEPARTEARRLSPKSRPQETTSSPNPAALEPDLRALEEDDQLSARDRLVIEYIAQHREASSRVLMDVCGCGRSTILGVTTRLIELGWIKRKYEARSTPNQAYVQARRLKSLTSQDTGGHWTPRERRVWEYLGSVEDANAHEREALEYSRFAVQDSLARLMDRGLVVRSKARARSRGQRYRRR